jgi:hypothetical protein
LSAFTRGGDVELSKTLAPWAGHEYDILRCKWVRQMYFFMFIPYKNFAEPMLIFEDIDTRSKYWLLSEFCFKPVGQVCLRTDPTPETANKGEHMKRYYRILTQIEKNITKVVRLKHPNYEVNY